MLSYILAYSWLFLQFYQLFQNIDADRQDSDDDGQEGEENSVVEGEADEDDETAADRKEAEKVKATKKKTAGTIAPKDAVKKERPAADVREYSIQ